MRCTILSAENFCSDEPLRLYVARKLCKPGSVFQQRLFDADEVDGMIALVEDFGEVIGWARTEPWVERADGVMSSHWDTLEAFVARDWRWRGVATFAAAGLAANWNEDDRTAAVFHPHMMLLANKVGIFPVLFRQDREEWVRA